jgi:hypothetical protein
MGWESIDVQKTIDAAKKQKSESTTSANAGGFAVPFGAQPLRPPVVKKAVKKKRRK